jgi:hypothetical protein
MLKTQKNRTTSCLAGVLGECSRAQGRLNYDFNITCTGEEQVSNSANPRKRRYVITPILLKHCTQINPTLGHQTKRDCPSCWWQFETRYHQSSSSARYWQIHTIGTVARFVMCFRNEKLINFILQAPYMHGDAKAFQSFVNQPAVGPEWNTALIHHNLIKPHRTL